MAQSRTFVSSGQGKYLFSLLSSFGLYAGEHAAHFSKNTHLSDNMIDYEQTKNYIDQLLNTESRINFYDRREQLGELCYRHAGIIKDASGLNDTLSTLETIQKELPKMGLFDKGTAYNTNLIERIKFENSLILAEILLYSALARKESRGAHYRKDFPRPHSQFEKEPLCSQRDNQFIITFQEVRS